MTDNGNNNDNKTENSPFQSLQLYGDYLASLHISELENMFFQTLTDTRIHLDLLYKKMVEFIKENQHDPKMLRSMCIELLKKLNTLNLPYALTVTQYYIDAGDGFHE